MFKDIKEEIKFIIQHPILSIFLIGMVTGIIPVIVAGYLMNILGI